MFSVTIGITYIMQPGRQYGKGVGISFFDVYACHYLHQLLECIQGWLFFQDYPGAKVIKLFHPQLTNFCDKLECLSLARFSKLVYSLYV